MFTVMIRYDTIAEFNVDSKPENREIVILMRCDQRWSNIKPSVYKLFCLERCSEASACISLKRLCDDG